MPAKLAIVAFVSQKGGTGKSTLARALAAVVAHAGLKVKIADLDPDQQTVLHWEKLRGEFSLARDRVHLAGLLFSSSLQRERLDQRIEILVARA